MSEQWKVEWDDDVCELWVKAEGRVLFGGNVSRLQFMSHVLAKDKSVSVFMFTTYERRTNEQPKRQEPFGLRLTIFSNNRTRYSHNIEKEFTMNHHEGCESSKSLAVSTCQYIFLLLSYASKDMLVLRIVLMLAGPFFVIWGIVESGICCFVLSMQLVLLSSFGRAGKLMKPIFSIF